jgi:hypothetical protein
VARANKKKQERTQKKRAEMQNEPKDPKEPAVVATTDTVRSGRRRCGYWSLKLRGS